MYLVCACAEIVCQPAELTYNSALVGTRIGAAAAIGVTLITTTSAKTTVRSYLEQNSAFSVLFTSVEWQPLSVAAQQTSRGQLWALLSALTSLP